MGLFAFIIFNLRIEHGLGEMAVKLSGLGNNSGGQVLAVQA